jgi:TM2 domain-containing membrane protein YozV
MFEMNASGKYPIIAAILSFLVWGFGHFYLSQWKRGGMILGGGLLIWFIVLFVFALALLPVMFFISLYSAYDAYKIAIT